MSDRPGIDIHPGQSALQKQSSESSLLSWNTDESADAADGHKIEQNVENDDYQDPELEIFPVIQEQPSPGESFAKPLGNENSLEDDRQAPLTPQAAFPHPGSNLAVRRDSVNSVDSWEGSTKAEDESENKSTENKVRWANSVPKRKMNVAEEAPSSMGESLSDKKGIWTKMARKTSVWEEDTGDNADEYAMMHCLQNTWTETKVSFQIKFRIIKHHPHIPIVTALCFLVLCTGGIIITYAYALQYEQQQRVAALNTAQEYGKWFSDQLALAALPLFAMNQFVTELPGLLALPKLIGQAGEVGAAPFADPLHRNVDSTCKNASLIEDFNRVAKRIKDESRLDETLVSLQYSPFGVVCLVYPLVNYEDFEDGRFLNNTEAIGLDLLATPEQRADAEDTVKSGNLVFAGPITLNQCSQCDPVARQAFIARVPINAPIDSGIVFDLNGQDYPFWGFATALINWEVMVERSGMIEYFDNLNTHFVLERNYRVFDETTGQYHTKRVVLVESADEEEHVEKEYFANATLQVTNNSWRMAVAYSGGWSAPYLPGAIAATIAISLVVSIMLLEVLVERQAHKNLIKEMLPKKAMRKIQRGEVVAESYNIATIFFSDIVGYTTLSAEMRPIKVMKLLNSFYTEVDKIAEKHGVYKIETIGDAYMCVGGCPDRCLGPEGAEKVALFALDMIELVKNFRTDDGSQILIRAGINSGPVVAGVVGTTRPQFTIFGDAVNAASRMESTSEKMKIQCSDFTYRLLRDAPNFHFRMKERGNVQVKGKGHMNTWWIEGVADSVISNDSYSGPSSNPFLRNNMNVNVEKSPEDSTVSAESEDKKNGLDEVDRDPMDKV